jgi:hypothetical protein
VHTPREGRVHTVLTREGRVHTREGRFRQVTLERRSGPNERRSRKGRIRKSTLRHTLPRTAREAVRGETAHPRAQNDAPSPRCLGPLRSFSSSLPRSPRPEGRASASSLRRAVLCSREEGEAVFGRHLWGWATGPAEGDLVCYPSHRERAGRRAVRVGHLLHGQWWSHQGWVDGRGRRHRCSRHTLLMCSASASKIKCCYPKDVLSQSP